MPQRIYRFRDLKPAGVPWTRKHVTTLEKRGEFPMHFQLGLNTVAWDAAQVDRWVERKIRGRGIAPRKQPNAPSPVAKRGRPRTRDAARNARS